MYLFAIEMVKYVQNVHICPLLHWLTDHLTTVQTRNYKTACCLHHY